LSTTTPATLATAMDTAEDDYATALTAAAVAERKAAFLADEIAVRKVRLTSAQGTLGSRLPSAIRGDSY
jgi:IMP cyclohydrolase